MAKRRGGKGRKVRRCPVCFVSHLSTGSWCEVCRAAVEVSGRLNRTECRAGPPTGFEAHLAQLAERAALQLPLFPRIRDNRGEE